MSTNKSIGWAVALALLLPTAAASQQDPMLVAQGAQVYSTTCARCHNARPAAERTDREWVAIVTHMRARANLTKSIADAVLAFLQATNAPEAGFASTFPPAVSVPAPQSADTTSRGNDEPPPPPERLRRNR